MKKGTEGKVKISPNGVPILHGEGVAAIRKNIQAAFAAARVADVAKNIDTSNEISIEIIDPVALNNLIKKIPTQPLREHSTTAVGRHRSVCQRIVVPKKSAQELIDAAMKAASRSKNAKT